MSAAGDTTLDEAIAEHKIPALLEWTQVELYEATHEPTGIRCTLTVEIRGDKRVWGWHLGHEETGLEITSAASSRELAEQRLYEALARIMKEGRP